MNWRTRVLQWFLGGSEVKAATGTHAWLRAEAQDASIPDRLLPEAQLELYQRLTWVQIAVGANANTAATTPLSVKKYQNEKLRDIPNHPFEQLLRRPNPLMSRAELIEATVAFYALTGNTYWWLNAPRPGAPPDEIWVLPPHKVKPVPDNQMYLRGYMYEADSTTTVPLEVTEVVHFRRFHPLNAFVGLSPIEALAVVAEGDMAMQKWNTNYFAKDNAKIPGALAFADPIDDDTWQQMKADIKDDFGGTKRRMMLLRNAGKGGVEWLPMAMSQADMQFLQGREATKEEIFAIYAPGLASVLAVNATEANSISGRRTFIEHSVWPHLVRIAEKITTGLLPAYGPDLVASFDDIRVTDKQLELAEQGAFAQVHTVDEVRERYYQASPLGDDRGRLLVTEVGKGMTDARDPEALAKEAQQAAVTAAAAAPVATSNTPPVSPDSKETSDVAEGETPEATAAAKAQEAKALRRWLRKRHPSELKNFTRVYLSPEEAALIAGSGEVSDAADAPFQGVRYP